MPENPRWWWSRRRGLCVSVAALAIALVTLARGTASAALRIPVERTRLANGLTVLVHEDRSAPVVSVYLFYRSGSRNERPGITNPPRKRR